MMVPVRPTAGHASSLQRRGGAEGRSRAPSAGSSHRGDPEGYCNEVAFEDDQAGLCGLPGGFASLLFGCTACSPADGEGQQRTGFGRIMDAWNVDVVDGSGEDPLSDAGENNVELDKVDVVLKLIDAGPASSATRRDFFRTHGWELEPLGGDRYFVNGREVRLILLPAGRPLADYRHLEARVGWATAKRSARIMVEDGPLKQPLLDYLMETGRNEQYDAVPLNHGAASQAGRMMSFVVEGQAQTRGSCDDQKVDAMKTATRQADMRQRAQLAAASQPTRQTSVTRLASTPTARSSSLNGARRV